MSRLVDLLSLTELKRWNVVPTTKTQTVAEHSFAVAVIALEIGERLGLRQQSLYRILRWAKVHDGPECLTGDLPSNLKLHLENRGIDLDDLECYLCPWYEGEQGITTIPEEAVVSIADAIEAGGWLAKYGAAGTQPIVDELKCKAMKRAKEYRILFEKDLEEIVGEVAGEVWKGEIPILLEKGRVDEAFDSNNKEVGKGTTAQSFRPAATREASRRGDQFGDSGKVRPDSVRRNPGGSEEGRDWGDETR